MCEEFDYPDDFYTSDYDDEESIIGEKIEPLKLCDFHWRDLLPSVMSNIDFVKFPISDATA